MVKQGKAVFLKDNIPFLVFPENSAPGNQYVGIVNILFADFEVT
jgi:hypothetical protein